jgi:hypothetical protein
MVVWDKVSHVLVVLAADLSVVLAVDRLVTLRSDESSGRIRQIAVQPIRHRPVEEVVEAAQRRKGGNLCESQIYQILL